MSDSFWSSIIYRRSPVSRRAHCLPLSSRSSSMSKKSLISESFEKPTYRYTLPCRSNHRHSVWPEKRDRNSQELLLPKKLDGCSREQMRQTEPRTRKGRMIPYPTPSFPVSECCQQWRHIRRKWSDRRERAQEIRSYSWWGLPPLFQSPDGAFG